MAINISKSLNIFVPLNYLHSGSQYIKGAVNSLNYKYSHVYVQNVWYIVLK